MLSAGKCEQTSPHRVTSRQAACAICVCTLRVLTGTFKEVSFEPRLPHNSHEHKVFNSLPQECFTVNADLRVCQTTTTIDHGRTHSKAPLQDCSLRAQYVPNNAAVRMSGSRSWRYIHLSSLPTQVVSSSGGTGAVGTELKSA